jgi:hypothetical protein
MLLYADSIRGWRRASQACPTPNGLALATDARSRGKVLIGDCFLGHQNYYLTVSHLGLLVSTPLALRSFHSAMLIPWSLIKEYPVCATGMTGQTKFRFSVDGICVTVFPNGFAAAAIGKTLNLA